MKIPKFRPRRLIGLLLIPPAAWTLIVLLAPTDWARSRLVAQLSHSTGRVVRLGSVRLGFLGAIRLRDMEIGEADQDRSPWLQATDIRIDLNLAQLIFGEVQAKCVEADGLVLRVHRRKDGSFEFGDLIGGGPDPKATARGSDKKASEACPLRFRLTHGRLSVVDETSDTRLEFVDLEGQGVWEGRRFAIDQLKGTLNGGPFEMAAQLDRGESGPSFDGRLRVKEVALGVGMNALAYLAPVLSGMPASLDGKLDLDLYLQGQGATFEEAKRTLVGKGRLALDPIALDGSRLVAELSRVVPIPPEGRVGSVRSDFEIAKGRVESKNLTLSLARIPLVLSGWTDFNGHVDYTMKTDELVGRLPAEVRGLLADLPGDLNLKGATGVRMHGTLDNLAVSMDGGPPRSGRSRDPATRKAEDRARLQELTRRLRDRVLR